MARRLFIHIAGAGVVLLGAGCAWALFYGRRDFSALLGVTVVTTSALAAMALVTANRVEEEARTSATTVVALAKWLSVTQQQLNAVRECGRSIEAALVELDRRMDGTWEQETAVVACAVHPVAADEAGSPETPRTSVNGRIIAMRSAGRPVIGEPHTAGGHA